MVLYPHHNLAYFKLAKWTDDWIQTAKALVRDEFERSYSYSEADSDHDTDAQAVHTSANMFDNIPALVPPKPSAASNELDQYLNTDVKHVTDTLAWWYDHHNTYPHLSHMALDYLTIPATSVDVEQLFSRGHLLLSHIQSQLSAQLTCGLLCLRYWSKLNLIKMEDVMLVTALADLEGDNEQELDDGWDHIELGSQ